MERINLRKIKQCTFGSNITIKAETFRILEGARIGDNVTIESSKIFIGFDSVIERDTQIHGLDATMDTFYLGDNTLVGFGSQIYVPYFKMLDYSQLHNSGLHSGYKPLTTKKAAKLIMAFKKFVPPYTRIMRIQRDIPSFMTEAGVDRTNLRQYVEQLMKKHKVVCKCIRCREIGRFLKKHKKKKKYQINTMNYNASKGNEFFIPKQD